MNRLATRALLSLLATASLLGAALWRAPAAHAFDLKRTDRGVLVRWHTDTVTIAVVPPARGAMSLSELTRATEIALDAWRGMPGLPALVVCSSGPSRPCAANVTIEIPAEWEHDPGRLAVTLDTFEAVSGAMVSARVLVNPRFPTAVLDEARPDRGAYDLASTLAHELGHVLGLAESGFREATMWPDGGRGDTLARSLDIDDEQAITTLYDAGEPAPPLLYACQAAPGARTGPAAALCLALGLGALAMRVRSRRHSRAEVARRQSGR